MNVMLLIKYFSTIMQDKRKFCECHTTFLLIIIIMVALCKHRRVDSCKELGKLNTQKFSAIAIIVRIHSNGLHRKLFKDNPYKKNYIHKNMRQK